MGYCFKCHGVVCTCRINDIYDKGYRDGKLGLDRDTNLEWFTSYRNGYWDGRFDESFYWKR